MGLICAVTFTDKGRLYYADPGPLTPAVGDYARVIARRLIREHELPMKLSGVD